MQLAPLGLVGLDLGVGRWSSKIRRQAPTPPPKPAASSANLPCWRALAPILDRPVQHLRGEHPVGLEVLVAGAVVVAINRSFQCSSPATQARRGSRSSGSRPNTGGGRAWRRACRARRWRRRPAGCRIGRCGRDRCGSRHRSRTAGCRARSVSNCAASGPSRPNDRSRRRQGQGPAQAVVGVVGVVEDLRELPHARTGAVPTQLEQLPGDLVGIARQDGGDRALAQQFILWPRALIAARSFCT